MGIEGEAWDVMEDENHRRWHVCTQLGLVAVLLFPLCRFSICVWIQAIPVISVRSEDPVRPVGGDSDFRFLDQAWALDFQISIHPDPRPVRRSAGTILSRDKICP
jgi:hypothetical protein